MERSGVKNPSLLASPFIPSSLLSVLGVLAVKSSLLAVGREDFSRRAGCDRLSGNWGLGRCMTEVAAMVTYEARPQAQIAEDEAGALSSAFLAGMRSEFAANPA